MGTLFDLTKLDFPLLSFPSHYSLFIDSLIIKNMCLGAKTAKYQFSLSYNPEQVNLQLSFLVYEVGIITPTV